jgi:uncharacterized damage-inducible protein DinB
VEEKEDLNLKFLNGYAENIGQWLSALEETRERTMELLNSIEPDWTDFIPDDSEESIGTILYHIAAIEASWLYTEVLQTPFPMEVEEIFPLDVRADDGTLTPTMDGMQKHLDRLKIVREKLLEGFSKISQKEFVTTKQFEEYSVSPVYVLHHLMQHEAEHRSQIDRIGMKVKAVPGDRIPKENV